MMGRCPLERIRGRRAGNLVNLMDRGGIVVIPSYV